MILIIVEPVWIEIKLKNSHAKFSAYYSTPEELPTHTPQIHMGVMYRILLRVLGL